MPWQLPVSRAGGHAQIATPGVRNQDPLSPEPVPAVLELRPAQREPFWFGWLRQPAPVSSLRARIQNAAAGTTLGVVRGGGRILSRSLRQTLELRALRFLSRLFSVQQPIA